MGKIHHSKQFVSFAIEKDIVDQLKAHAESIGLSRSAAIRQAVLAFVAKPLPVEESPALSS